MPTWKGWPQGMVKNRSERDRFPIQILMPWTAASNDVLRKGVTRIAPRPASGLWKGFP